MSGLIKRTIRRVTKKIICGCKDPGNQQSSIVQPGPTDAYGDTYSSYMRCCGIKELAGVSGFNFTKKDKALKGLIKRVLISKRGGRAADGSYIEVDALNCAFVLFTAVQPNKDYPTRPKYGDQFRDLLLKHELGKVIESDVLVNPNSSNPVKVYLWEMDSKAVMSFIAD